MVTLTTQQQLEDAKQALHNLKVGRSVVSITDQNGEKLTFIAADINSLEQYVNDLAAQINPALAARGPRALRFIF